ncbi:hypothetical protein OV079_10095 [Nannocystis pusilla]|uniref:Uncharacterized protein n=1 Tax=Nannocystis pusilla TaxID=889268 RepID=A0A9X3EUS5_9BACT|nr:hypothetical protein [Nannocystis pusilla]MCY1005913.1 hypothetical protein [Nannocystis pusilla]
MMRPADLLEHAGFWRAHYSFCLSPAALDALFAGVERDTPLERTPFYLALFGLAKQAAALRSKEIRAAGSVDAAIQHALAADPMCALWPEMGDAIRADYRAAEARAAAAHAMVCERAARNSTCPFGQIGTRLARCATLSGRTAGHVEGWREVEHDRSMLPSSVPTPNFRSRR